MKSRPRTKLVLRGDRMVISKALRMGMVEDLHAAHQGIALSLRRAQESINWPNTNHEVKDYISDVRFASPTSLINKRNHSRATRYPIALVQRLPQTYLSLRTKIACNRQGGEHFTRERTSQSQTMKMQESYQHMTTGNIKPAAGGFL